VPKFRLLVPGVTSLADRNSRPFEELQELADFRCLHAIGRRAYIGSHADAVLTIHLTKVQKTFRSVLLIYLVEPSKPQPDGLRVSADPRARPVGMSPSGTNRPIRDVRATVAIRGKADFDPAVVNRRE
jgi:hypothetical protein